MAKRSWRRCPRRRVKGRDAVSDRSCALVMDQGRVLMVLQTYGGRTFWTLPGGSLEPGEPPSEAARREVREETGLDVRIVRHLVSVPRDGAESTYHCFLAEVRGGTLRLGGDVAADSGGAELHQVRRTMADDARRVPEVARALARLADSGEPTPEPPDGDVPEGTVLRDGDLRLRPLRLPEDVDLALPWYQDPEVMSLSEGRRDHPEHVQVPAGTGRGVHHRDPEAAAMGRRGRCGAVPEPHSRRAWCARRGWAAVFSGS